ncbi:haloacid dehalogenase superfamily, subfamily IA, variant 3 with third motif having DD or ED/haloacid dehalogenase superfamily, subfamily IA, variant 1 with third motif having Dx(3-4)D or Dx(3-4)E [Desulfuromusa kysingii]|uniref:phosphoglycolate phosphatase n=1 Tax=Desulfuromusa kysingii TaxID=37625 RepID=A0A1H3YD84_9BACT|nr:HAD family phosphatase [Desulfuromusa kysingii]SEA09600.1 haloacid dehalogenase superfamily, subfamily IA, variant 3 with third motif having DD or ED/haloacid dehalogenase superfamily, subfamily IA, variant 1 with third motif having Dx(3-4)D or Dx(3-4)E [Desulfuromusa kysingii]
MSRIEAVIFDCDGVMFESRRANLAYYNRILKEFSYPLVSADQTERAQLCHTASSPDVLSELMRDNDLVPALRFAATLDYREFIPQMEPEPHLTELLTQLRNDYPLAIATNRGKSILSILDHFDLHRFFSSVVTSHDVERPKPAPDMLLLAASYLDIAPENCLFIGDSVLDKAAAAAAGMLFAGYGGVSGMITLSSHHDCLEYFVGRAK